MFNVLKTAQVKGTSCPQVPRLETNLIVKSNTAAWQPTTNMIIAQIIDQAYTCQ